MSQETETPMVDEVRIFVARTGDGAIMLDVEIIKDNGDSQKASRLVPVEEIGAYGAPQKTLKAALKVDVA